MSTFYFNPASLYAQSTSVASGKTVAAVAYMLSEPALTHNYVYVAPTIALVEQTARDLQRQIAATPGHTRNLSLVHSELDLGVSSFEAALSALNGTQADIGSVVILTTRTFLKVLPLMRSRRPWRVILDEAFKPLEFLHFKLGRDAAAGRRYFAELFQLDEETQQVRPAEDKAELVRAVASQDWDHAGTRFTGMQSFADAVINHAMRCELVDGTQQSLTLATYVTPEYFRGFAEVVFLAALFDHSILFHLWTRHYGIDFAPHPYFARAITRNVHQEQGPLVAVGHVLHQADRASRYTLERNWKTGTTGERRIGKRVIDRCVEIAAQYFTGSRFLLQVNNWAQHHRRPELVPKGAHLIKVMSHGLNAYKDYERVASLAVTNPDKAEARWVMSRTGLTEVQMYQAYRIHAVYQAVGRCAIRDAGNRNGKVFLVCGYDDARFLHGLFVGSQWLGQVGGLPAYRKVRLQDGPDYRASRNRRDALMRKQRKGTLTGAERLELAALRARPHGQSFSQAA